MRLMAAATLWLVGAALLGWAASVLGWRRWLDLDDAPQGPEVPRLVLRGPFGVVRNPQTLALLLVLAGAAVRWPRLGLWVPALVAATLVVALAVSEEPRLATRFGTAYARYQQAVPFLLPRFLARPARRPGQIS